MGSAAPTGTVTLLFTDIEGSTQLLERLRDRYAEVLEQHRDILRAAFDRWGGYEVDTQGDSFFAAFPTAADALACAIEVQRTLMTHPWPDAHAVRVRMGLHTGEPMTAGSGYVGIDVHRGARIGAAAHGGQILVSAPTRDQAGALKDGVAFESLGVHRFKGLSDPIEVFQVQAGDLLQDFPPIKTAPPKEESPAPGSPPYKGLLRFDEGDAARFFGRERVTAQIVQAVRTGSFLAVVGASGSGKSSIVRAGVIPALKKGGRTGGKDESRTRWNVFVLTPTATPLDSLVAATGRAAVATRRRAVAGLRTDPEGLPALLRARARGADRILLVVDQLEELFTQCRSETDRAAFIDALMGAAGSRSKGGPRIGVLVTLRADFYANVAAYPALRDAVAAHQAYVGPMDAADLRRAIEEPARLGGWQIAPGLVDLLLRDIAGEPGALPLLSHALLETWRRRRGVVLTPKGYFESGEVRGAIAKTADRVYGKLPARDRPLAKDILLRLTELGEGAQDTRRRAALDELVPAGARSAERTAKVLGILADARLVTVDEAAAEVAHEALIREWPALREWLNEDREGLRIHRQLTETAREWKALAREESLLFRGARLATAREWAQSHGRAVNALERAFLRESEAMERREEEEREAARQRELDAARKAAEAERLRAEEQTAAAGRLRRRAYVLAAVVVVALGLGVVALFLSRESSRRATVSTGRELASAAVASLPIDPERSLLLALEAVSREGPDGAPLQEAVESLHRAVQTSRVRLTLRGHEGEVVGGAVTPDGKTIASMGVDGTLRFWSGSTGRLLREIKVQPPAPDQPVTLAFSPDGTRLAAPNGTTAGVWDVPGGAVALTLRGHRAPVQGVVFSPDGRELATVAKDSIRTWEATTGRPLRTIDLPDAQVPDSLGTLAFSPDGTHLAVAIASAEATVWDLTAGEKVLTLPNEDLVASIAYSPDGSRIVTGNWAALTKVWDGRTGRLLYTDFSANSLVNGVDVDPSGMTMAVAASDGSARIVELATGRLLLTLAGHGSAVMGVHFTGDGDRLVTDATDETVRVWDVSPAGGAEWRVLPATDRALHTAYSSDGRLIASGAVNGVVRVWEAATGKLVVDTTDEAPRSSAPGPYAIGGLTFTPDGRMIVEAHFGGDVIWRDAATGLIERRMQVRPEDPLGIVSDVAFSSNGRLMAVSRDGGATIFDASSGQTVHTVGGFPGEVPSVDFSPDGRLVGVAGQNGRAQVIDVTTGALRYRLLGHTAAVRFIEFSPDGAMVVTGSNDGTARVWDARSGKLLRVLRGHKSPVYGLSFAPDGSILATASIDATIKLWSVEDFEAVPLTLSGHSAAVYSAQFSPDGTRLLSSSRDTTVRLEAIDVDDLIRIARQRLTRGFTVAECQAYLHLERCP